MTTNESQPVTAPLDTKTLLSNDNVEKTIVSDPVEAVNDSADLPATTDSAPAETSPETAPALDLASVLKIEEGYVHKRGPLPLRLWQKRYFRLPSDNLTYPLHKLRIVYQKNAKKQTQSREDFEKINKQLLDSLATASVNASSMLTYFKTDNKDELPQGLINFKYVIDIIPSPKIRPFAFTIKTETRDYVFSASNQAEADSWVAALKALVSSDVADYSDTSAYKFSYSQLAERRGFASPSSQNQDEEVFSASEAEFEPEPESTNATEIEKPQEKVIEVKNEVSAKASNRRSLYTEVIGLFHKSPKSDSAKEVTAEAPNAEIKVEDASVVAISVVEPLNQELPKGESVEDPKSSEFSKEIAEMVAPIASDPPVLQNDTIIVPVEESSDNGPKRSKTFKVPKFEGKVFSKLFKKNGQVETPESKEVVTKVEEATSNPEIEDKKVLLESSESASESKAITSNDEIISPATVVDEIAKEASHEISALSPPEVKDDEIVKGSEDVQVEIIPEATKEQKQPFIKRLLSGSPKNKATVPVVVSESDKKEETDKEPETAELLPESIEVKEPTETEPQAESKVEQKDSPAAQRQTSLIGRIGEIAYSAVSPPEESEQISEHFVEKIKDAKHSGFLFKQSTLFHTNNLRFVVLSADGILTYYRNAQTPSDGKKLPILNTTEVGPMDELIISIKPVSGSTYYFQAKTSEDRDAWQSALAGFSKPVIVETPATTEPSTVAGESNTDSPVETKPTEDIKPSEELSSAVPIEVKNVIESEEPVAAPTSEVAPPKPQLNI